MASISLNNVSVNFPVYNASSRSLKSSLLTATTGGKMDTSASIVVINALKGVNLYFSSGDSVALLGHHGAGKSTLLRVIAGIYEPVAGSVSIEGNVTAMFDPNLGISMDASGWENIETRGILMGLDSDQIDELTESVVEISGLGEFLSMPVRTYSRGMRMRLAFSVASSVSPDILLLDETILAGDAEFLAMARKRLDKLVSESSLLILASHSQQLLRKFCNKGILMNKGQAHLYDSVDRMLKDYKASMTNQVAQKGA